MAHWHPRFAFLCCLMISFGGVMVASTRPALAAEHQIKLCNETSYVLNVATAFQSAAAARSQGWQSILPGQCNTVSKTMPLKTPAFVYAHSDRAHAGEGLIFSGNERFCIVPETAPNTQPKTPPQSFSARNHFAIDGRRECRRRGYVEADFAPIRGTALNRTVTFTEKRNYGRQRAAMAGIQRLLRDLGYQLGTVDGFGGARTREAVTAYQTRYSVSKQLTKAPLLAAMIKTARQKASERGLLVCNRTAHLVWAATGVIKGDTFESRGWLRVLPKQCGQAINQNLDDRYYFYYAEAVNAEGHPIVTGGQRKFWGGNVDMCIKDTKFAIEGNQSCQARGYETAGFQQIDTGTTRTWRVNLD
jgi:uncharacterized membrane protein